MTAAIYIRQTESGPDPSVQRAECVLAIEARKWATTGEFVDVEASDGRPGSQYRNLLLAMRGGLIRHLVAYSVERMFRNVHGMQQLLEFARVGEIDLTFCKEGIHTGGVNGEALVNAMQFIADIVHSRNVERMTLVNADRKRRGLPIGRPRTHAPALEREIAERLEDGMPVCAVARELGVSRNFVRVRARDRVTQAQE